MVTISGYNNIKIGGIPRKIATVKHGQVFYIWFEDVRDVNTFNTTGYIIQKNKESIYNITPINKGGILPENVRVVVRQIINTKPDWERQTPEVTPQ